MQCPGKHSNNKYREATINKEVGLTGLLLGPWRALLRPSPGYGGALPLGHGLASPAASPSGPGGAVPWALVVLSVGSWTRFSLRPQGGVNLTVHHKQM
jgi:hypothetical protein